MSAADRLIRWGAAASVLTLTGIAATVSYGHAYQLATHYGESGTTARVLPVTTDGLIGTCSLVLLDAARRDQSPPWHAWPLLGAGVTATLAANVAHGAGHGLIGALVAGWPAVVACGSFELLLHLVKTQRPQAQQHDRPVHHSGNKAQTEPAWGDLPETVLLTAREQFAPLLAQGGAPSVRAIKRQLRVGHARAVQIHAALTGRPR